MCNQITDGIIDFIEEHEGFYPQAYPDGKFTGNPDHYSIGWGCYATSPDEVIDKREADRRLRVELNQALNAVTSKFHGLEINEPRLAALVSMAFQLGAGVFDLFKITSRHIREGNWGMAAVEAMDSDWFEQTPNRAKCVCKMLASGQWPIKDWRYF